MAGDPAVRYASSAEIAAELRRFLGIKKRGLLGRIASFQKSKRAAPSTEKEQREDFWK
jgi:hypothetical protein